jgi:ppGpp synthetase/RelA/SpoT-type nucleotidyltranferase
MPPQAIGSGSSPSGEQGQYSSPIIVSLSVRSMPLPDGVSRSKMDKLGVRLVADPTCIAEEDYELLERILGCYQASLDLAQMRLQDLGIRATTRVKSTSTLVEKLVRQQSMKMKGIQDIAGGRIVLDGGRLTQDHVVMQVVAAFPSEQRPPRVIDRRATPTAGYRAVHVVVHHLDLPIEIQVRTLLQDSWAQIVERLGDVWGRGLRYDEDFAGSETVIAGDVTRATVMQQCREVSEAIHIFETREALFQAWVDGIDETSNDDGSEEGPWYQGPWDKRQALAEFLMGRRESHEALSRLRQDLFTLLGNLGGLVDRLEAI